MRNSLPIFAYTVLCLCLQSCQPLLTFTVFADFGISHLIAPDANYIFESTCCFSCISHSLGSSSTLLVRRPALRSLLGLVSGCWVCVGSLTTSDIGFAHIAHKVSTYQTPSTVFHRPYFSHVSAYWYTITFSACISSVVLVGLSFGDYFSWSINL